MPLIRIDCKYIKDWDSFHNAFAERFGFPGFYGRNMNAWVDCMSDLDEPETGMATVTCSATDPAVLQLDNVNSLPGEIPVGTSPVCTECGQPLATKAS